ncbi:MULTISPECIES: glutamate-1-semialdehyde 2,1-aminomutase [Clostridia]|jgi:glutamate-1-semialdehyde 2,1-aminomutase|uniref:Glutamate-1-semialdehyde 2,1-aminomutase n=4 Tax=Clostridia TaxID=186801 RepID=G8LZ95_ACECE|nr:MULTISPECIES: glutamate-1-semialdehyde 2,1-aminomutase [Clostridia]AEV70057.1 glutamate-1-semialdehyde-2,1-aminomutase [Acetivibrio clariflavus DSM 19732]MBM7686763.1 glutamate-1-semialdehyde 2,1-aminomutase [Defluviitalea raffinosedens]MBZ4668210.1 glutamate-semialdehyde--aminomutase [Defluviitaleaceae bacterium]ODM26435.1 glutamate-1-semialdehyde-2,1-aminomutase [Clostridium sp. Bc-iso-3]
MMSSSLIDRARSVMPGGVNSPVRSYRAVGGEPVFIKRANGSKIYDVEDREYIDYVCSWGPMILGHNNKKIAESVKKAVDYGLSFGAPTEKEVIMAELITSMVPGIDMIRMVNSGTEAVMSALRLARAFTEKSKIIKFDGCYHGHCDSMLVKAGSGALTLSHPDSLGVTGEFARNTLIADYNDIESVRRLFAENKGEIAAVILEPVAANMGVVPPRDNFLAGLRALCDENGALLIFDEVITGFRLCPGGAQEYFDVRADIVTFGKIIGGGMPVGAYGGRKEIMELVSPLGGVYQAGTLSGNPIAMAAGIAQLTELKENKDIYLRIDRMAESLEKGFKRMAKELELTLTVNRVGSLLCVFFTKEAVTDFKTAKSSNTKLYAKFFKHMLDNGIHMAPAQFEAMFVSDAHTEEDIEKTLEKAEKSLREMKNGGDFA